MGVARFLRPRGAFSRPAAWNAAANAFIAVVLSAFLALPAQAAEEGVETLEVVSGYPSDLEGLGVPLMKVSSDITAMSADGFRLSVREASATEPMLGLLQAVATGEVEAVYSSAGFWQDAIPAAPLFSSMPFGPSAREYFAWLYYGKGLTLYRRMYAEHDYPVYVIPCAITPPESSGWFSTEINSLESLQGLRMRFFGLGGKVMEKLGVQTSFLSADDIRPALEAGQIDATEFSMPSVDQQLGMHDFLTYNYFPGWHQQAAILELLVNQDRWERLSPPFRAQIETACKASMTDSLAAGEAAQYEAIRKNVETFGVNIRRWPDELLAGFEAAWQDVAQEEAARDAFFDEVYEDLTGFQQDYRIWRQHGFLPQ